MAISKKGSRNIIVNELVFRWLIRRKATYSQMDYGIGYLNVAIELFSDPKNTLVIFTDRRHPKDIGNPKIKPITPSDIRIWIEEALNLGWKPFENGRQFRTKIVNGKMQLLSGWRKYRRKS